MSYRPRILRLPSLVAALAVTMCLGLEAAETRAERSSQRGISRSQDGSQTRKPSKAPVIRVSGKIERHTATGLAIGREALYMQSSTAVYPTTDGLLPRRSDMLGKEATVFGRRTAQGIEPLLILLRSGDRMSWRPATQEVRTGQRPSESNPKVGELDDSARN